MTRPTPVVLCILDGWGERDATEHNAIAQANTPHWDAMRAAYPFGVLDASEAPPTFQVEPGRIVGLIAGGDGALRKSSEGLEDDPLGARAELAALGLGARDTLVAFSRKRLGICPSCGTRRMAETATHLGLAAQPRGGWICFRGIDA